jgi:hypothetical protein
LSFSVSRVSAPGLFASWKRHTREGRKRGTTKKDFFKAEQEALEPFQPGLFDDLV